MLLPMITEPLNTLLTELAQAQKQAWADGNAGDHHRATPLTEAMRKRIVEAYRLAGPQNGSRHLALAALCTAASPDDLATFADLIVTDPPCGITESAIAFAPLFQQAHYDATPLFPRLLDGLADPNLAVLILDLANYITRNKMAADHPASVRKDQLAVLLGGLIQRLTLLQEQAMAAMTAEESPAAEAPDANIPQQVAEGVSLAVALCHALALIGDRSIVGKLYPMLELNHRQLRVEAAAALVHLGEKKVAEQLVKMAAEPSVRLRVLAYAEELDLIEDIAAEYRSPVAIAEAELVAWLSQPAQFGLPPHQCELLDSRTQFWPGYTKPITCYLFQYIYQFPQGSYANVGIAGPLLRSITTDLNGLPPEDIYALFAGWQTEHEEVIEFETGKIPSQYKDIAESLTEHIRQEGCEQVEPIKLGIFFGQPVLIATATRNATKGVAILDQERLFWCPQPNTPHAIGPDEAYCMYKGRKLLATFNESQ